jgi:oxygen-independent coproporphyrinogen-3 oxidase
VAREIAVTADDRLRAAVIERLMCDLAVDVGPICEGFARPADALDGEIADVAALQRDGLCTVFGRRITAPRRRAGWSGWSQPVSTRACPAECGTRRRSEA